MQKKVHSIEKVHSIKRVITEWKWLENQGPLLVTGFPHTLENSGKWHFYGKSGKSQGICQTPQGILENSEISGNFGYGRFKCCFWEMLHSFSYVLPWVSKPPSCMEAYIHVQYTKNRLSFKITCDAHCIVKLALHSENALASLGSLAYS